MPEYLKSFLIGVLCAAIAFIVVWWALLDHQKPDQTTEIEVEDKQEPLLISPDTVLITPMPSYRTLNGTNVVFNGKKRYPQNMSGRYGRNINIVSFSATGENAYKSAILITWEDGSIEIVPNGTVNLRFPAEKRAKEIVVQGYSVHERKVFRDTSRDGVLNWAILYEQAE